MIHNTSCRSIILLLLLYCGCASYREKLAPYYNLLQRGQYADAEKTLSKNNILHKKRNQLLYFFEQGKINHLLGNYKKSNEFFNQADDMLDNMPVVDVTNAVVGKVANPMLQKYKPEDFEKFMIHYYMALNYLYLDQPNNALVEARRIQLRTEDQELKFKFSSDRYNKDTFALIMEGLVYESMGQFNNAFICYQNAIETYQKDASNTYYGVTIPLQLKKDAIRTAYLSGLAAKGAFYEKLFDLKYEAVPADQKQLVVFWENGLAPVRISQEFNFTLVNNVGGFFFMDVNDQQNLIPFVMPPIGRSANLTSLAGVDIFRVAYYKYLPNSLPYNSATITKSDSTVVGGFEKVQDINTIAIKTLHQRALKELGSTLSRLAIKKAVEYTVLGLSRNSKNKDMQQFGEIASFGIGLYSALSEQADTRNWQSLPAEIFYSRIPIAAGETEVKVVLQSATSKTTTTRTIPFKPTGGRLSFSNVVSIN